MSIKTEVKQVFTQAPASFVFPKDDTAAVHHGAAILQCPRENKASLVVQMPPDAPLVVQWNTNLLVLLCVATGWMEGDTWLAAQMRIATQQKLRGLQVETRHHARAYRLIIDRLSRLMTLTVEERPS